MTGTVMPCARTHSQRPESCIRCNMPELMSNQLLILAQRPDATTVAGYRAWQSLGRQVRRGAKGIGIFGYSTKTSVQEVTDSAGHTDEKTTTRTFFPVRTVFDISDTHRAGHDQRAGVTGGPQGVDHGAHQPQHTTGALEAFQGGPVGVEPVEQFRVDGVGGLDPGLVVTGLGVAGDAKPERQIRQRRRVGSWRGGDRLAVGPEALVPAVSRRVVPLR